MAAGKCAGCEQEFTGLTAFDRHQTTAYGTDKPVTCHDPATRGLVRQPSGRWGFPADDATRLRLASLRAGEGEPRVTGYPPDPEARKIALRDAEIAERES